MKILLIVLMLMVGCVQPEPKVLHEITQSQGITTHDCQEVSKYVVQIISEHLDESGNAVGASSGSGIVVGHGKSKLPGVGDSGSVILTAKHVVDDSGSRLYVLQSNKRLLAKVVKLGNSDWAFISVEDLLPVAQVSKESFGPFIQFEECLCVGHPASVETPTVTVGRIQDLSNGMIRSSASITFGSSGGGLFIKRGDKVFLAGVTVALYTAKGYPADFLGLHISLSQIVKESVK